jgi:predicted PurR-regulated permease PerM
MEQCKLPELSESGLHATANVPLPAPLVPIREWVKTIALAGLFVLGWFYTVYLAREFFIPFTLAIVFKFMLNPLVRVLNRFRLPLPAASLIVMMGGFALFGGAFFELSSPVSDWVKRMPAISARLQQEMEQIRKPVEKMKQASEQVQSIAGGPKGAQAPQQVELREPSLFNRFASGTYRLVFGLVEFVLLLFFLLASGDMFLRKLIHVLPRFEDKKRAVQIARGIEDNISRYLLTVAFINIGLGSVAALVFALLGLPNPLLWGTLACVLNFVPYLGGLTTICVTTIVSVATFPTIGRAILPPLCYLLLACIEGGLVSPWIVGRRMTLNPVVIFTGVTLWGFVWGVGGALLAVPLLVMLKIFCDHIEPLASIGEFLGALEAVK